MCTCRQNGKSVLVQLRDAEQSEERRLDNQTQQHSSLEHRVCSYDIDAPPENVELESQSELAIEMAMQSGRIKETMTGHDTDTGTSRTHLTNASKMGNSDSGTMMYAECVWEREQLARSAE